MEEKIRSRTDQSLKNTSFNFIYKIVDVILAFVLRAVFIRMLSVSYLGVQGLFTNILTVLSLMEGGFGAAIAFSLYKPLANKDEKKVASLMKLYKKIYLIIGFGIMLLGLAFTPLLKYVINLPKSIDEIYIIYFLTIINTSSTYFFSYRRTLLIADQHSDINTKNLIIFRITRFIILLFVLLFTKNYVIYLAAEIVNTIISNICITFVVKKKYNSIDKIAPLPLEKEEKTKIKKYMLSGLFTKIGQTVVSSTDNILISAFISTILVGYFSNYSLIINNIEILIYLCFSGITASIGNFAVKETKENAAKLFKVVFLLNYLLTSIFTICSLSLITPFVSIWAGQGYVLDELTVIILIINFYIATMGNCTECFLSSQGMLFYKNKFRPLIEAVTNIGFSILFVKVFNMGITGVFLGTTVCFLCGRIWMDAHTIYKYWFKTEFKKYIFEYLKKLILTAALSAFCYFFSKSFFNNFGISVISWIICGFIIFSLALISLISIYKNTTEFKRITSLAKNKLTKLISKK